MKAISDLINATRKRKSAEGFLLQDISILGVLEETSDTKLYEDAIKMTEPIKQDVKQVIEDLEKQAKILFDGNYKLDFQISLPLKVDNIENCGNEWEGQDEEARPLWIRLHRGNLEVWVGQVGDSQEDIFSLVDENDPTGSFKGKCIFFASGQDMECLVDESKLAKALQNVLIFPDNFLLG